MEFRRPTSRRAVRGLAAVGLAGLALTGCSLSTGNSQRPTTAHIVVTGSASGTLELVVSTDFYETQNQDGTIDQVLNTSDTKNINLPYDAQVDLSSLGGIVVQLTNTGSNDATVRMQVTLDNGQGYDHSSTLPQGKELKYVYVYTASIFG